MRRKRKAEAKELLAARDTDGLLEWSRHASGALDILFSLTHAPDERMVWRAIEANGKVAAEVWKDRPERVRDHLRRMLWLMSDESGGLGWYATEVIAEVLHEVPELVEEFGQLLPHYLVEEPFERGAHFGLARVGHLMPRVIEKARKALERSIGDADPVIRFHAIRALAIVGKSACADLASELVDDRTEIRLYDFASGELYTTSPAEAAREILGSDSNHASA